jgi:hypothetical protein
MATETDVATFALGLPNVTEGTSYGTRAFHVAKKLFIRWREEGDSIILWVSDLAEKEAVLASDTKKFWTTPHYDGHPTVLVRFGKLKKAELEDLIEHSYRQRASKTSLKLLDAS